MLPFYTRQRLQFHEIFQRTALETINSMNQNGQDVANQLAVHPLTLPRMGISRHSIPVMICNPLGGSEIIHMSCNVKVHVNLSADKRGIHVSRLGDTLARLTGVPYQSLQDYADQLCKSVKISQEATDAHVEVEGVFSYLEEVNGVKLKRSLETFVLTAESHFVDDCLTYSNGIGFNHITACPCVQATYKESHAEDSTEFLQELVNQRMPLLTHSQRCHTRITMQGMNAPLSIPTLLNCIDTVVVRCQNTMPRDLELLTVYQAHRKPQFLEDVLRDLLKSLYTEFQDEPERAKVRIQSLSMESIHDFDLDGEIEYSIGELNQIFSDK